MTAVSTQSTEASYSESVNCIKMHMDENAKGENQIIKSELKFPTRQKKGSSNLTLIHLMSSFWRNVFRFLFKLL